MTKKKPVKVGTGHFVMLKADWPEAGFRRTVRGADGEVVRVLKFTPGEPVELCEQDFAAVENDIGPALLLVDESARTRRPKPKAQAARTIDHASKVMKAVAPEDKTGFLPEWIFQKGSIFPPDVAIFDLVEQQDKQGNSVWRNQLRASEIIPSHPVTNIDELVTHLQRWQSHFHEVRAQILHSEKHRNHIIASQYRTALFDETRRELHNATIVCHEWLTPTEQPQFNASPADIVEAAQQLERLIYALSHRNVKRLRDATPEELAELVAHLAPQDDSHIPPEFRQLKHPVDAVFACAMLFDGISRDEAKAMPLATFVQERSTEAGRKKWRTKFEGLGYCLDRESLKPASSASRNDQPTQDEVEAVLKVIAELGGGTPKRTTLRTAFEKRSISIGNNKLKLVMEIINRK